MGSMLTSRGLLGLGLKKTTTKSPLIFAMSTKRLIIQVSEEQLAWIDSQVEQFSSRASVIRGLINLAMQAEITYQRMKTIK